MGYIGHIWGNIGEQTAKEYLPPKKTPEINQEISRVVMIDPQTFQQNKKRVAKSQNLGRKPL